MSSSRDNLDNMDRDQIKNMSDQARDDLNADPITGEPGSHPVGTGLGATGGAAAGAAIGAVAGPVGSLVGGVIGAIAGAAAGHAAGEAVNPTEEEAYWRENYTNTSYYQSTAAQHPDLDYDRDYSTAYRVGYENRAHYNQTHRFEDAESDLSRKWDEVKGESRLKWEQAKDATRDAWDRASNRSTGTHTTTTHRTHTDGDLNRDPITGEPGSHPVGTGVGGVGGAAAGAAIGSVAGPVGTVIGGAIGAVAGGAAGHATGEAVNPTDERYVNDTETTKSHPIGTSVGGLGGAAAGAAVGSAAGPVGTVVGGVIGAVAGGAAGHAAGEAINPTEEEAYWRNSYTTTPYYSSNSALYSDLDYDRDYAPAYRLGYENRSQYQNANRFEDAESDLGRKWEQVKGESRLKWEQAKDATRDAWNRVTR